MARGTARRNYPGAPAVAVAVSSASPSSHFVNSATSNSCTSPSAHPVRAASASTARRASAAEIVWKREYSRYNAS